MKCMQQTCERQGEASSNFITIRFSVKLRLFSMHGKIHVVDVPMCSFEEIPLDSTILELLEY